MADSDTGGAAQSARSDPADACVNATGSGLSWSFDADLADALAAAGRPASSGTAEDQDEVLAEWLEAMERDERAAEAPAAGAAAGAPGGGARDGGRDLSGLVAEYMPAGPGLAAWLSQRQPDELSDRDLPGAAAAFRKVASWAQAAELAVVAQIAARSAARDDKTDVGDDGRPAAVTRDAAGQVSFALALSPSGAGAWADLAVTLTWRLPAALKALYAGEIDLYRAKILAEAVAPLDDDAARQVEGKILPHAGGLTYGQLHSAVRRAVMAADPEGAEQRREAAERRARVSLYADQDHTAALAGSRLPAVHAAAAMARISAMARALHASGAGGGMDLLRAQVFLGLLLGTLPVIPPPTDGPPDAEPPPGEDGGPPGTDLPPDEDSGVCRGDGPSRGDGQPPGHGPRRRGSPPCGGGQSLRSDSPSGGNPPSRSDPPSGGGQPGPGQPGPEPGPSDGGWPEWLEPSDGDMPPDDGYQEPPCEPRLGERRFYGDPLDDPALAGDLVKAWPPVPVTVTAWPPPGAPGPGQPPPVGDTGASPPGQGPPGVDPPGTGPPGTGPPGTGPPGTGPPAIPLDEDDAPGQDQFLGGNSPGGGSAAGRNGRPATGLLDLTVPFATLTCESAGPGLVGRIGPVTALQTRRLARLAARDHSVQWRVIVTDEQQHAIAVARLPRFRLPASARRPGETGVVGRVTVVVPATAIPDSTCRAEHGSGRGGGRDLDAGGRDGSGADADGLTAADGLPLRAILDAAARGRDRAVADAAVDQSAAGGCAHTHATAAYRPSPRIREHVTARDQTCRQPYCGQPAWRGDLDHTTPYDRGGLTCACNLGPVCRTHHILKQLPGWTLTQTRPGYFTWTTSAGRTYTTEPDTLPR